MIWQIATGLSEGSCWPAASRLDVGEAALDAGYGRAQVLGPAAAAFLRCPESGTHPRYKAAAAAARGDTEQMSLWAGQSYRSATEQPVGEIIERLSATENS
jgi:NAD(P)H-dependent flavin oxidoreductase YrpB (nitropropane dioxygenase family)